MHLGLNPTAPIMRNQCWQQFLVMSKYISKSLKEYRIEGDKNSGYKIYNSRGIKSVYAFDEPKVAKNHIENLEKGKDNDVPDFKKTL